MINSGFLAKNLLWLATIIIRNAMLENNSAQKTLEVLVQQRMKILRYILK